MIVVMMMVVMVDSEDDDDSGEDDEEEGQEKMLSTAVLSDEVFTPLPFGPIILLNGYYTVTILSRLWLRCCHRAYFLRHHLCKSQLVTGQLDQLVNSTLHNKIPFFLSKVCPR